MCLAAKSYFINSKIKDSDDKIKTIWNIIKKETGKNKSSNIKTIQLKTPNGETISKSEVAQEFETFFSDIPIKTTEALHSSPSKAETFLSKYVDPCSTKFEFEHISPEIIVESFKQIKIKSSEDLWGMSMKVCTPIIVTLAPHLALLFNKCLDEGTFPDLMKESKVIPLFKAGDTKDPGNYRPVSILPVLSKVFEKILMNQLLRHFNLNKIFHPQQFGFTKGRSTADAGISLIQHIFEAWEERKDAIGIFCDLSKAFDCVDHQTLITKLIHYGIKDKALELLKSYLFGRVQKVFVNGNTSPGSRVQMGVPQGSILGPILFLIYINDLPFVMERLAKIVLFADDTSLIFKVHRVYQEQDITTINNILCQTHEWFTANNLVLNAKKTKCIHFKLPNVKHCIEGLIINNE